jgi:homoserine O-acetyltransferase/O-succinyltransferase
MLMRLFAPIVATLLATRLLAQGTEADAILRDFRFSTGETLPELRLHYTVLGQPRRDASGTVSNAVMILHGTGGSGRSFMSRTFGGELFGPGKLLDTARYYVILPDNIGHGRSSKPSDGMRARFPRYTYDDMVHAQKQMLAQLGVSRLRLVMGTSMGCMHAWIWGYTYPNDVDGLVPLACVPTQIAGRNRMMRRVIIDNVKDDPAWNGGNYTSQPPGLKASLQMLYMMSSAPLVQHRQAPTRDVADSTIRAYVVSRFAATDANDMIYQFDSSRDYDPSPHLEQIKASVLTINSADDLVNPPELGLMEKLMPRVKRGRYVLIPISDQTRGHGTHSLPAVWGSYLKEFLDQLR